MAQAHAPVTRADLRRIGSLYPPGTFDGIWAAASLVHLSDAEACDVLQQLAALLRPGGRLFTCVMSEGETGWLDEPDGTRWYTAWEPHQLEAAVADDGLVVEDTIAGPYVELVATRPPTRRPQQQLPPPAQPACAAVTALPPPNRQHPTNPRRTP